MVCRTELKGLVVRQWEEMVELQRMVAALQLDHLLPLPHNQALQLGVRQTVGSPGRQHPQNESDSRPPENRKIIPPLVLPLLRDLTVSI